jgi:hypothetical protein
MGGPEHYRRAEELAAEAHGCSARETARPRLASGPPWPRPMRCSPWPPPPPSAHPVQIPVPGPTPRGPGSDPDAAIIDASRLAPA